MSLEPITIKHAEFIDFVQCSICWQKFSSSMEWAWPFCSAGIPHEQMDSREQIRRQKLLAETPEKATASYVMPMLKLYGPTNLKAKWEEEALPSMPPTLERVILLKENFKRFSDQYKVMGVFIGNILGKHDWSMLELLNYSKRWLMEP